ncbi:sensor histidine kinase [Ammoniphilus sp. CFH 90114]|uniref:sensor histidine kinase n=1 Tax=Ammoniphilus sp. CFH 90114 TaxID=2493665 RepID=UPI00100E463D|nr:HAMP domain-containing sensor histidine kinase [Ammoniphilus sp. CFH 90114]RXT13544.1 HAMP domain-containing histidine kinase [Ammoniphilus sp. CFH 90114]
MLSTDRTMREHLLAFTNEYVSEVFGKSLNYEILYHEKKEELVETLQQALMFVLEAIESETISLKTVNDFAGSYAEHYIIYFHDAETLIRDCSELKNRFLNQIVYPHLESKFQARAVSIISTFVDEFMIRLFKEKQWELERLEVEKFNAIGNMASGMAHELRNPITSIKGFLKLIYEMHPHPEEIHHYYTIIDEEVKRLDYILERFLSLTKRRNLPMKREFEEVDISRLIDRCVSLFEFEFIRLGIETIVHLESNAVIRGNSKELEQTFINIIKNACEEFQRTPEQREKLIRISCRVSGEKVMVLFFNNGSPISPSDVKQIFNPFYSTKENGTGLGLAICKQIIEAHGGKINIYPEPDGTMVELKLPWTMET